MKDYLNWCLDEPSAVGEIELRVIVKLLLEHLNLDAVRYDNENFKGIALEGKSFS